jgi:hypothetical protein
MAAAFFHVLFIQGCVQSTICAVVGPYVSMWNYFHWGLALHGGEIDGPVRKRATMSGGLIVVAAFILPVGLAVFSSALAVYVGAVAAFQHDDEEKQVPSTRPAQHVHANRGTVEQMYVALSVFNNNTCLKRAPFWMYAYVHPA